MYHIAPAEARRRSSATVSTGAGLVSAAPYRPLGNYLWDSFEFALWYAQAYDDYDIWAVSVEGLQLLPDPDFGEFADGVEHAWFSRQPIAAERLRGIEASYGGETPEQLTQSPKR